MKHCETWSHVDRFNAGHAAGERETLTRDPLLQSGNVRVEPFELDLTSDQAGTTSATAPAPSSCDPSGADV